MNSYSRDGVARLIGDPVLPLTLIPILFDATGHPQIQVTGSGEAAIIEVADDLGTAFWTPVTTNDLTSGSFIFTDSASLGQNRFYRARLH